MTPNKLLPCHCGHEGELAGIDHGAYLSLSCPECKRETTAFTMGGLVESWNKPSTLRLVTTLGDSKEGQPPFQLNDQKLNEIEQMANADAVWALNPAAIAAMVLEIRELRARHRIDPIKPS